jgi:hypothetical protein
LEFLVSNFFPKECSSSCISIVTDQALDEHSGHDSMSLRNHISWRHCAGSGCANCEYDLMWCDVMFVLLWKWRMLRNIPDDRKHERLSSDNYCQRNLGDRLFRRHSWFRPSLILEYRTYKYHSLFYLTTWKSRVFVSLSRDCLSSIPHIESTQYWKAPPSSCLFFGPLIGHFFRASSRDSLTIFPNRCCCSCRRRFRQVPIVKPVTWNIGSLPKTFYYRILETGYRFGRIWIVKKLVPLLRTSAKTTIFFNQPWRCQYKTNRAVPWGRQWLEQGCWLVGIWMHE